MSETMHLVCLKDTGHILAGLAQITSGASPEISGMVGGDFPIANQRGTDPANVTHVATRTLIPADLLELKSVPFDPAVLGNPLGHAVDGGRVVKLPLTTPPPLNLTLEDDKVELDNGEVDLQVLTIVARRDDPTDQRRVQMGTFIDTDGDGNAEALTLPLEIMPGDTPAAIENSGDYAILVAYQSIPAYWVEANLP